MSWSVKPRAGVTGRQDTPEKSGRAESLSKINAQVPVTVTAPVTLPRYDRAHEAMVGRFAATHGETHPLTGLPPQPALQEELTVNRRSDGGIPADLSSALRNELTLARTTRG